MKKKDITRKAPKRKKKPKVVHITLILSAVATKLTHALICNKVLKYIIHWFYLVLYDVMPCVLPSQADKVTLDLVSIQIPGFI